MAEKTNRISRGKENGEEWNGSSLEDRCKIVLQNHQNDPLFVNFAKQYLGNSPLKKTILREIA